MALVGLMVSKKTSDERLLDCQKTLKTHYQLGRFWVKFLWDGISTLVLAEHGHEQIRSNCPFIFKNNVIFTSC